MSFGDAWSGTGDIEGLIQACVWGLGAVELGACIGTALLLLNTVPGYLYEY